MAQNVVGAFNVRAGLDSTQFRTGCKDINNAIGQSAVAVASSATKMMTPLKGVNKHIEDSRRTFRSFQRDAKQVFESTRTSSERYAAQVAKLSNLHKRGFLDAQTYARGIAQARGPGRFARLGAGAGMMGMAVGIPVTPFLAVGAAIGGVGKAAHTAESFTRAMNQSLAIMGDVSAETRREMEKLAFATARTTIFSPKETAGAYYFLASAGLDVERSMAALPKVAKFAQAGMFDLATATSLVTDAQSALGMKVKDPIKNMQNLTKIMDVLVKANTLADASVHEFAEALSGPLAGSLRTYNRSLTEGVALLALLAERGQKGPEASEAGMVIYRDLPRAVARNRDAFRDFGIEIADAHDNLLPMPEIILNLTEGLGKLSDIERAGAKDALGLTRSLGNVIDKMFEGTGELHNFESELRAAAGTMDDVSGNQMTDFQAGWQDITAVVGEATTAIGKAPLAKLGRAMSWVAATMKLELPRPPARMFEEAKAGHRMMQQMQQEALAFLEESKGAGAKLTMPSQTPAMAPEEVERLKALQAQLEKTYADPGKAFAAFSQDLDQLIERGLDPDIAERAVWDAFDDLGKASAKGFKSGFDAEFQQFWDDTLKEAERVTKFAESIMERMRTPEEKLGVEGAKILEAVRIAGLPADIAGRAITEAAKRVSPKAKEIGAAPWIEAGTQAEAIREWEHRAGRGADPMKEIVDSLRKELEEIIRMRELLEEEAAKEVKVLAAPP